jgi:hypothetical protein
MTRDFISVFSLKRPERQHWGRSDWSAAQGIGGAKGFVHADCMNMLVPETVYRADLVCSALIV